MIVISYKNDKNQYSEKITGPVFESVPIADKFR